MRALRRIRLFAAARDGVSAIEFALIAPLMILMYFGIAEFTEAYMAQKRAGHVASVIADLTSQENALTQDMVDDIFAAGEHIMDPFPSTALTQRITSIERRANGTTAVQWSRARGTGALGSTASIPIPAGVLDAGETIIVAEVVYGYRSTAAELLPNQVNFSSRYYLRPRLTTRITCC